MALMAKTHMIETFLYACAGVILVVSSPLVLQESLPVFGGSFFAHERGPLVSFFLPGYGVLLMGCALLAFFYARRGVSFGALVGAQLQAAFRLIGEIAAFIAARAQDRAEILLLVLVTALGVGVRGYFLNQPMRMDESYT